MELTINEEILNAYGFNHSTVTIHQIGSGHINRTFLLSGRQTGEKFILQQINTQVFKHPEYIAENIENVAAYLRLNDPDYLFPAPIATLHGNLMTVADNEYWRLFPYIENTIALDVLSDTKQAYEAAKQFGKLSRLLNNFPAGTLKETIRSFHDLNLRYSQFLGALEKAPEILKATGDSTIQKAFHYNFIPEYYNSFLLRDDFPDRVMHHDTKISNVLLDKDTFEGICVIDLDTLMPGKFISDLGDMMRTYLCAFSENEVDQDKIKIRIPYFSAMLKGYLEEMKNILTATEKELILFSGKYIVYMQALRFLTDYLNGNIYYPVSYPGQNLDRAKNQFKLLAELYENEHILQDIVDQNLTL